MTDDSDIPDSAGPVSFASLFTAAFGNDGFKDSNDDDVEDADALAFSLSITGGNGTASGLVDVLSGDSILLRVNANGDIEGYVSSNTALIAFTIDLDPNTGSVSLVQNRAITHNDPTDPAETGASAAGWRWLIVLTNVNDALVSQRDRHLGLRSRSRTRVRDQPQHGAGAPWERRQRIHDTAGRELCLVFTAAFGNEGSRMHDAMSRMPTRLRSAVDHRRQRHEPGENDPPPRRHDNARWRSGRYVRTRVHVIPSPYQGVAVTSLKAGMSNAPKTRRDLLQSTFGAGASCMPELPQRSHARQPNPLYNNEAGPTNAPTQHHP